MYNNYDEQQYYNEQDYERESYSDNSSMQYDSPMGNENIIAKFNPYLLPGEQVYWVGKTTKGGGPNVKPPNGGGKIAGIFFIVFAIMWIFGTGGIMNSMNDNMSRHPMAGSVSNSFSVFGMIFPMFGVIFLVIGIIMIVRRPADSCYAITDQRVMAISKNRFSSIEISKISNVTMVMGNNGIGTVNFANMNMMAYVSMNPYNRHPHPAMMNPGFSNIPTALYSVAGAQNAYRILSGLVMNNQNRARQ